MLKKILPDNIFKVLEEKVNFKAINEIRFRVDKPILLNIKGKMFFLGENGATSNINNALIATKTAIEDVIFRASECSIYSVNEQIKKGFIVAGDGIRIGIGGDLIVENGIVKTMTNFNSCNIRIPHNIKNCSLDAFRFLCKDGAVENTLIVSPPGCGKTTFLKDFVCQLSERNYAINILLLDERGELDCKLEANFFDKICFASKKIGIENGIRSLAPDLVVCDEIGQSEDIEALRYACRCGVKILASTHSDSIDSLCKKQLFEKMIQEKIFSRIVLLSKRNGPGTIEGVYDSNFARIYVN